MSDIIFSFGTLQLAEVQRGLFGETVAMTRDALAGYIVSELRIADAEVIAMSGTDAHPALIAGTEHDIVSGVALKVTSEQLAAADHYERVSYRRVSVTLVSGRVAWAYIPKN